MNGRGNIPFSEVALYAAVHGFTQFETQELWREVHQIDMVYSAEFAIIDKAAAEKSKKPS